MSNSGLAWSTVTDCAAKESADVQHQAALATPTHDYVPWVLVDGKLLQNTNALTQSICNAYTGPKPASCKRLQSSSVSVCFNDQE